MKIIFFLIFLKDGVDKSSYESVNGAAKAIAEELAERKKVENGNTERKNIENGNTENKNGTNEKPIEGNSSSQQKFLRFVKLIEKIW